MSRILIIDDDINLLHMVKLMLERVGHQVDISKDGEKGIVLAAEDHPDLAIIDVMMPGLSGYDVVRKLRQDPHTARIPIIILTARSQPMDKEMALEAGANAFLSKPVAAQELIERVDAVLRAGVNYRVHTGLLAEPIPPRAPTPAPAPATPHPTPAPTAAAEPTPSAAPARPAAPKPSGRKPIGAEDVSPPATTAPTRLPVVTVISLRGGTGGTTVAVNLAFALANQTRRVCLADLSTASGHVHLYLHLTPPHHWGQLLGLGDSPDPRTVNETLVQHPSSGIAVFAAPVQPPSETLSVPATQHVLRELVSAYNPVVVDARHLDPATTGALQVSSAIVVVMSDDPPSIQTTGQLLGALHTLGVEAGRVRLALNHVRPVVDVPAETIQKAFKRPLTVELPFDAQQPNAIRRGLPVVTTAPDSPFAKGIQQLARTITL